MASFLDELRERIHNWTESLWDDEEDGFRMNAKVGVNVMTTTDVAWMRYATDDEEICGGHRQDWVGYLQRRQDPKTGIVAHDPGPAGQGHSNGHALWQTVRALNILGDDLLDFPHYLRGVATPDGLASWFDSIVWDGPKSNHHEVLALTPFLAGLNDPDWTEMFYRKIAEQQDPTTGAWPRGKVNISRTFAYTCLHRAAGRMPPRPEKIVNTILSLQKPSGFWEDEPRFLTMDSTYILARLPKLLDHRTEEARNALHRLLPALRKFYEEHRGRIEENPHWMSAIVHTFSLLQETFPNDLPSRRRHRFDWDDPAMYYCEAIAQEKKL
ncbi:MAG: hypothetical protein AB1696_19440 [Planctomycetota bacterium]